MTLSRPKPSLAILLIEDDALLVAAVKLLLAGHRLSVYPALRDYLGDREAGDNFDLVLLDLCNPGDPSGEETLALFATLKQRLPQAEIVVQSGVKEIQVMKRCLKLGAQRFLLKDFLAEELPLLVEQLADRGRARAEVDALLHGRSQPIRELKRQLLELRFSSQDVLIEGETGSGKELCARALHVEGPFVAVNVSAVPRELFEAEFFGAEKGAYTGAAQSRGGFLEQAEGGVLFLDEIQSLDPSLQAKLLRALESRVFLRVGSTAERRFRGRVVAASNQSLKDNVARGLFREDLYYRLFQAKILVPPLRVRGEDIVELAEIFLGEATPGAGKLRLTDDARRFLEQSYDWPGNVRELKSTMRRFAGESRMPLIDAEMLAEFLVAGERSPHATGERTLPVTAEGFAVDWTKGFDENVSAFERHLLTSLLATKSTQEARERLRLSRTRFYEKLKHYRLGSHSDGST